MKVQLEEKICVNCGLAFSWRKKWEKDWNQVKYCSQRCKKGGGKELLKSEILQLLKQRGFQKTICPSEILSDSDKKNKTKLEEVRMAARLLCHEGKIQITQKGRVVDPLNFRGPIRLKLQVLEKE